MVDTKEQERRFLLAGCRVLDLADEKGAYCGRVLGDFGADVIAVEPPGGNPLRRQGPFFGGEEDREKSLPWFFNAANKRGITLNLDTDRGRDLFLSLVETADIVVESAEPGYLERLRLGYAALRERKPSVVLTSISPFGQSGPYGDRAASDLVLGAMAGLVRLYGYLDSPPLRIGAAQAYFQGALQAAMASVLAFYAAELTGRGQWVDVSVQEALTQTIFNATETWEFLRVNQRGAGPFQVMPRPAPAAPLLFRRVFRVKDGFVTLLLGGGAQEGMLRSTRKLVAMANADGFALPLADYPWQKQSAASVTQGEIDAIVAAVGSWLETKTKAELYAAAVGHGLLLGPVSTIDDSARSPQLAAREFWPSVEHPALGQSLTYPAAPLKLSEAGWGIRRPAPLLGEHNEAILGKEFGLGPGELAQLAAEGAI